MADEGPWSKYQSSGSAQPAAPPADGPWAKYAAPAQIPTMTIRPDPAVMAQAPAEPPQMMGPISRFATGFIDPVVGGAQLATHVLPVPDSWTAGMDRFVADRERRIAASTPQKVENPTILDAQGRAVHLGQRVISGPDPVRLAGEITNPIPYAASAVTGNPILQGALMGGAAGALSPVTKQGHYWSEKAKETGAGAVAGGATGVAGKVVGAMVGPRLRPVAQALVDAGVPLTPGQMAGGIPRRAEEALRSLPITGTSIANAERRAMEGFNRATANKALEPIGVKVPNDLVGHDIIAYGQGVLSKAYNGLLPNLTFKMDTAFGKTARDIHDMAQYMPEAQRQQFNAIFQGRVVNRLAPNGIMSGETMDQVQSELLNFAQNYRRSTDAAQRQLGDAVFELREAINDTLERQNPAAAEQLRNIRLAYAMFVRVEGAAANRALSQGTFTAGDLLQAIKTADKTTRKRQFAAGDALLQDWAGDAQDVLGHNLRDSGTQERMFWDYGIGVGSGAFSPHIPISLLGASVPYRAPVQDFMQRWAANPAPWQDNLRTFIQNLSVGTAPAAADTANTYVAPQK